MPLPSWRHPAHVAARWPSGLVGTHYRWSSASRQGYAAATACSRPVSPAVRAVMARRSRLRALLAAFAFARTLSAFARAFARISCRARAAQGNSEGRAQSSVRAHIQRAPHWQRARSRHMYREPSSEGATEACGDAQSHTHARARRQGVCASVPGGGRGWEATHRPLPFGCGAQPAAAAASVGGSPRYAPARPRACARAWVAHGMSVRRARRCTRRQ